LRIAFITPSVSRAAGGIFEIERRLAQSLNEIPNTSVSVYSLHDKYTDADLPAWQPLIPRAFPVKGTRGFGYSSALKAAFQHEAADIAHLHAMWMFTSVVIHKWSKSRQRPYIVTPNGMLEPWALRNSTWKKLIAGLFYERQMLVEAACLQANTEKEAADIRAYGLRNPICVIPNGVDLPEVRSQKSEVRSQNSELWPLAPGRKVLLYLGRIHPKKGLVNLLRAWGQVQGSLGSALGASPSALRASEWVLAIAGWDQGGHEDELKNLTTELGIPWADVRGQKSVVSSQWSVVFLGPQFGDAKNACYANCDAFILPSFSEGLPMVLLEAWSHGTPLLMTPQCNLPEGFASDSALRITTDTAGIKQGLQILFEMSDAEAMAMGQRGFKLVSERFTWPEIARQMRSVYEWVLGAGSKPECLIL
jgi:poly(glycerol-phosphate) alpha-glucosyltransferase